jgi:transposase
MRENDGRKLDHPTLELVRLRAIEQVLQGARPEDVAASLGMHRKTVYAWLKKYREGGQDALLARPVPGRPPRLSEQRLRELSALLIETEPRQFDFEAALWTRAIVREVIQRQFGVSLSSISVSRQLEKLGLAPRLPMQRARQRHPEAMARWQRHELPRIMARAAAAGATVYFADEVRQEPGTSPVPGNPVPERPAPGNPVPGNIVSAGPVRGGTWRFAVFDAETATGFAEFCARLVHDVPGLIYLITDGQPAYRARAVTDFAAASRGNLELFYLPAA